MKNFEKNISFTQHLASDHRKKRLFLKIKQNQSERQKNDNESRRNIFEINPKQQSYLSAKNQLNNTLNFKNYEVCGDETLKKTFLQKIKKTEKSLVVKQNSNDKKLLQTGVAFESQPITIYLSDNKHKKFLAKLSRDQQNGFHREKRSLQNFRERQKSWKSIQNSMKIRLDRFSTVSFDSVNKSYRQENAQKIDLINDMIPEYWRNSLRNNDKKLQSHVKGNQFKKQIAEQMLQTIKGTHFLEQSIPKIANISFKSINSLTNQENLKIKGKSVKNQTNCNTMRSFYQIFNAKLTNKLKENQQKRKFKRFNPQDTQLDDNQKEQYQFSKNIIEMLTKIDKQPYRKSYIQRRKWLNEAYEMNG